MLKIISRKEASSVAGLSSICMAAKGKVAKVRGIILPFINYSEVNCKEAALKEQALSNRLVSINLKVSAKWWVLEQGKEKCLHSY